MEMTHVDMRFVSSSCSHRSLVRFQFSPSLLQRIDLSPYDQKGCNELLLRKGFFKKEDASTVVPLKYITGPYTEVDIDQEGEHKVEL